MNPLLNLEKHGQAVWLDYIRRNLLTEGDFLFEDDGLRGVTSNPTIFEKAIGTLCQTLLDNGGQVQEGGKKQEELKPS